MNTRGRRFYGGYNPVLKTDPAADAPMNVAFRKVEHAEQTITPQVRCCVHLEVDIVKPILESCCGLDVHRDQVTACIASGPLDRAKEKLIVKEFSTMTYGLRELSSWLKEHDVETVAMESTGVFWKPIFNILEDDFEVLLANAARVKNVPGLKTDKKRCSVDCEIASLWIGTGELYPVQKHPRSERPYPNTEEVNRGRDPSEEQDP